MKRITINDIAKTVGVSRTTVSRVISNNGYVSKSNRAKILEVIKKSNYKPSIIARGLRTKKTRTIGLLIPDLENPAFGRLAKGISESLTNLDYNLIICNSNYDSETEKKNIDILLNRDADGIIIATPNEKLENIVKIFIKNSIPIMILEKAESEIINYIAVDHYYGGQLAAEYLIRLGHKNIFFLGNLEVIDVLERYKGFKDTLEKSNIFLNQNIFLKRINDMEECKNIVNKILEDFKNLDAIFAANDIIASQTLVTLYENNIRVPEEISVIGYDNIPFSEMTLIPLTTIMVPLYSLGEMAAKELVKIIENPLDKEAVKILLKDGVELIERKSCKNIN